MLKVYDACNQRTAILFLDEVLRRLPFRVHVVQTDNGAEFQSQFHWHLETLDIRHVYIRPRTPHLNGKVVRSHRVHDQEFYQLLDSSSVSRSSGTSVTLEFYRVLAEKGRARSLSEPARGTQIQDNGTR